MMTLKNFFAGAVGLCCFVFFLGGARAAQAYTEPLKLTVTAGYYYGQQKEPIDRVFRVRVSFPRTFYVTVKNVSSSAQEVYGEVASSGYSAISFEIRDEAGNTNVVRRKKDSNASTAVASAYLNPGEEKVFEIDLSDDEWENAFKLYRKGSRKAKVRAIYQNDFKTIYSEYYEVVVIDAPVDPKAQAGEVQEPGGVLVSK